MTSALLRRGGRRAPGIGGRGVGGVGARLASRRGGGTGSRRWMALTENRLLKQHDISWNGGSHTHTNMHSWQTHTHPCFPCHSALLLLLRHFPLLDYPSTPALQVSSKPPCPAWNRRSKAFFICIRRTPTRVHSRCQLLPRRRRRVPSISTVFHPLSLRGFSRKPNAINEPCS